MAHDDGTVIRPTLERLRQAAGEYERFVTEIDDEGRKLPIETLRMLDGSLLDRLINRNPPALTGDQFNAGSRFYADWYYSGMANSGTLDPSRDIVDGGRNRGEETDRRLASRERYHRAIKILILEHGLVMQCCVLTEESLESFGCRIYRYSDRKLGRTAALTTLRNALSALDEHYHGKRQNRYQSAHVAGYRPDI